MAAPMIDVPARIESLLLVAGLTDAQKQAVKDKFTTAAGDWNAFATAAAADFDAQLLAKLKWANTVGDWSLVVDPGTGVGKDDKPLVDAILKDASVASLRDLALKYGPSQLFQKLKELSPAAPEPDLKARAALLRARLYASEPTAVFTRMVEDGEFVIPSKLPPAGAPAVDVKTPLVNFLRGNPAFKFEQIATADIKSDVAPFSAIPGGDVTRQAVVDELQELDALQEVSPTLDVVLAFLARKPRIRLLTRLDTFTVVAAWAGAKAVKLRAEFGKTGGDWSRTAAHLSPEFSDDEIAKLTWVNTLAEWSFVANHDGTMTNDDKEVVKQIYERRPQIRSLRDLAREFNVSSLALFLGPQPTPQTDPNAPVAAPTPELIERAETLRARLFDVVPTPVFERMVADGELPFDDFIRSGLTAFFRANPALDLKTVSEPLLDTDPVLASVDFTSRTRVASAVLTLKSVEQLSPAPETATLLMSNGLISADAVAQSGTKEQFRDRYGPLLTDATADAVYDRASAAIKQRRSNAPDVTARIASLQAILTDDDQKKQLAEAMRQAAGVWADARPTLAFPGDLLARLDFANELAIWSEDRVSVVGWIGGQPNEFTSLLDVARKLKLADLAAHVDASTVAEKTRVAQLLRDRLAALPSAEGQPAASTDLVRNMIDAGELPVDAAAREGIRKFFNNQPNLDIARVTPSEAFAVAGAFDGVTQANRVIVERELRTIWRLQNLSPSAAAALRRGGIASAFQVAEMPQAAFVRRFGEALGGDAPAKAVHAKAVDIRVRNEKSLTTLRETVRGTGIALLDGREPRDARMKKLTDQIVKVLGPGVGQALPNLTTLFGSLDTCECGECSSVYSLSAYYVDLLNFLRNNNFDPIQNDGPQPAPLPPPTSTAPTPRPKDPALDPLIANTPLVGLFRRRPDLRYLKLTCENSLTVLPYIDLANEVMESFVVHLEAYRNSGTSATTRYADIDVFDVGDETTGELLAEPRHVNYRALCTLSEAVHPFTLPYHHPIESIRISLDYLGTKWHELIDRFRRPPLRYDPKDPTKCFPSYLTEAEYEEYKQLHAARLDRAFEAEFLGFTNNEYVIVCHEAFWKKRYFELRDRRAYTDAEYRKLREVGVREPHQYYGFADEAEMVASLPRVKEYLLKRTGVTYRQLVELVKTRFVNPLYPRGRSLKIFVSLRESYRILQALVDQASKEPEQRFRLVLAYLFTAMPNLSDDEKTAFRQWVYCRFEPLGRLIVLNRDTGLPVGTILAAETSGEVVKGRLNDDGSITLPGGGPAIGVVKLNGEVVDLDDKKFTDRELLVRNFRGELIAWIKPDGLFLKVKDGQEKWTWTPVDRCDVGQMRLVHLDGTPVGAAEYDRLHRFIRLWRKLGWTIDETDKAVIGLTPRSACCHVVANSDAPDDCSEVVCRNCGGTDCCDDEPAYEITPDLLGQLAAVKDVLARTGLDVIKQLTFWSEISTEGDPSLYQRLFLAHNVRAIDDVFKADQNGLYLADAAALISGHTPVVTAALKLKETEVAAIRRFLSLSDGLSLGNVSALYRTVLLAKALGVRVPDVEAIRAVFGDPFASAAATLTLLKLWSGLDRVGLTVAQLHYVLNGVDDPYRPVGLPVVAMLRTKKALFDGLSGIDTAHPDLALVNPDPTTFAVEVVQAKAGLLFDQSLVASIVGLVEGTAVYSTRAPRGLGPLFPEAPAAGKRAQTAPPSVPTLESLRKKLKYVDSPDANDPAFKASLQVTGILTGQEVTDAKALKPGNPDWAAAVDRVGRKPVRWFNLNLAGLLGVQPLTDATGVPNDACSQGTPFCLLTGDQPVTDTSPGSSPRKRQVFLTHFLPYLRKQLKIKFIVGTVAGLVSASEEQAEILTTDCVHAPDGQTALATLEAVNVPPGTGPWTGYLLPTAESDYRFYASVDRAKPPARQPQPPPIDMESPEGVAVKVEFTEPYEDPDDEADPDRRTYFSKPVRLKKVLYRMRTDRSPDQYEWQPAASARRPIPPAALLPECSSAEQEVFRRLDKAAMLVRAYKLTVNEIDFWRSTRSIDFDAVRFETWRSLQAYAELRDSVPTQDLPLVTLLRWARDPARYALSPPADTGRPTSPADELPDRIAQVTGWSRDDVNLLLEHFDLRALRHFTDHVNLAKLRAAVEMRDHTGINVARLFTWAEPTAHFNRCRQLAADMRAVIRARYDQTNWEQAVKPLNDKLRARERDALMAYLLVQPELIAWGVVDSDSLFEFFLIDPKMEPIMETSRLKQAVSSVQQFIHRALMGLEERYGVRPDQIDRTRWEWMQRYRVWEANRKVFLYPENWLRSELRDDKSPFFEEYQSECMQSELTEPSVAHALRVYVNRVNEVSNLRAVGLFAQGAKAVGSVAAYETLYLFGRTRTQPFKYFARTVGKPSDPPPDGGASPLPPNRVREWRPWSEVAVDVPACTSDQRRDSYLVPAVWQGRPLMFVPQLEPGTDQLKVEYNRRRLKSISRHGLFPRLEFEDFWVEPTDEQRAKAPGDKNKRSEWWSISLGYSELSNGKWSSRVVSGDIRDDRLDQPYTFGDYRLTYATRSDIARYRFVTDTSDARQVRVSVYYDNTHKVTFVFDGQDLRATSVPPPSAPAFETKFQYSDNGLRCLQADILGCEYPRVVDGESYDATVHFSNSLAPRTAQFGNADAPRLVTASRAASVDDLFDDFSRQLDAANGKLTPGLEAAFGYVEGVGFHELHAPNALYNWELTFHAPMLAAEMFLKSQRYDEALRSIHRVFDPLGRGHASAGRPTGRVWKFLPFQFIDPTETIQTTLGNLQAGMRDPAVSNWRDHAFQPHVVARDRPSAYMKWVVMKYVEILIAYGDYYFRQNSLETLPVALNYYVLASHIFGPPGEVLPKTGTIKPQSYDDLLDKWDAFGNAMVMLEDRFPVASLPPASSAGAEAGDPRDAQAPNVFGGTQAQYFCVPDNPRLTELRKTIDERLFNIRNSLDINGIFRKLPLFDPPIDPALLVQAAAQGLSIASVLNDLASPVPNYRFASLLQKAFELCAEVRSLGNAFLAAKEKRDSEAISRLRAGHETGMHKLILEVRKLQVDEANKALDALVQSRKAPEYRLRHFLKLIGGDASAVPGGDADFAELQNLIDAPVDESGLKLSQNEKQELDKAKESADRQQEIGVVETLGSVLSLLPQIGAHAQPLGPGASFTYGGLNLGAATMATARGMRVNADRVAYESSRASRLGGFQRQIQDRIQLANIAGYEIKSIDKQIIAQRVRVQMAELELKNQQRQIDDAVAVEDFLRSKYTNQDLYAYMEGQLKSLHYEAYKLAYDLAKKAERVYQFERSLDVSDFIKFGYWEPGRDGLFAGERLYQGLKQLEAANLERRPHDFEVTKHVSVRQVNPLQLLVLRETGRCEVELPEFLFDMDYPGHYRRRIKSVSLSVPCVVGPHTSLNCTLRLLEHRFRVKPLASSDRDYPQKLDEDDDRFATANVPVTAIAVSEGRFDTGTFELNFHDERFVPFEGAGAVSRWRIELPDPKKGPQPFDYATISDVILHIRYTSVDGGENLKRCAQGAVAARVKSTEGLLRDQGVFAVFDLRHDFADGWNRFAQESASEETRTLSLGDMLEKLPYFAARWSGGRDKVKAEDILLLSSTDLKTMSIQLVRTSQPSNPVTLEPVAFDQLRGVGVSEANVACDSWQLKRASKAALASTWLVVRLRLTT